MQSTKAISIRRLCAGVAAAAAVVILAGGALPARAQTEAANGSGTMPRKAQPSNGDRDSSRMQWGQQLAQQRKSPQPSGAAQPAEAQSATSAWAVNCTNQKGEFVCEMTQAIVDGASRAVIMLISLKKASGQPTTAALFRSVHGVYLPAGLTVQIDAGKPTRLDFQKSDGAGVYAALPLDAALINELKRGRELTMETELNKGQKFALKAPLTGFGAAYDRVMSTN